MMSGLTILVASLGAIVLLVGAAFLLFTGYLVYIYWKYSHLPSPKRSSFYLGHFPEVARAAKEEQNDELPLERKVLEWYREVGAPLFVFFFFGRAIVVVVDPDCIKQIAMNSKFGKSKKDLKRIFSNMFGERFLGNSLFSIPDYETWSPRRKLYDPAFKKSYLKSIVPRFNECTDVFIEKLRPLADGETMVPMKQKFAEVTMHVISKVGFGEDFNQVWSKESLGLKHAKEATSLSFLVSEAFRGMGYSSRNPFYQYLHPFEAEGYRECVRALRTIGRECIKKRIKMLEDGEELPNDILTHILQMASTEESVKIEDLVDDFVVFYVAGQETTSVLLAVTLILLHQHPIELERVQAEVAEVLAQKECVSFEDLEKLQYTEQVLRESLRKHPSVPASAKQAPPEGATLNGYKIPGGTVVVISAISSMLLPEFTDDPESFIPSRFDPGNKQLSSFSYFPFGIGHRSCIGKHFAMMEAKIVLARFVQTFNFSLPQDYKLVIAQRMTSQPKDDVPCTLQLRSSTST